MYLAHFYAHWAGHTPIDPEELELVVDVYSRPGAFTSSIAWYRARAARRGRPDAPAAVEIPTIALWGDRDPMRPLEHRECVEHTFPYRQSKSIPHLIRSRGFVMQAVGIAALLTFVALSASTPRAAERSINRLPNGGRDGSSRIRRRRQEP